MFERRTSIVAIAVAVLATLTVFACGKGKSGGRLTRAGGALASNEGTLGGSARARNQSPDGVEYGVARTALNRVKLGDKFYVASVLNQIFGPEAAGIVEPLVRNNVTAFGGPCDQFGRMGVGGNHCAGRSSASQASMIPTSMATREGFRMRACEAITQKDGAIIHAIALVSGAAPDKEPSSTDVAAAYELFFPGITASKSVRKALIEVVAEGGAPLESWRLLYLTLCLSPDWQIL